MDNNAPYVPGHGLLTGRTAVITAAAGTGIGGATARRFLEEGARVVLGDAHERRLKETVATLAGEFGEERVAGRVSDVTDEAQIAAMYNSASVVGWRAQAGQAHYAAAKAGVMALTRCAAVEAAAYRVRVNAVSPSLAMHPHLVKVTTPELLAELTEREALGRYAEPWEVANVIVFLASGYSSYMTGETVSVSSQHP